MGNNKQNKDIAIRIFFSSIKRKKSIIEKNTTTMLLYVEILMKGETNSTIA